MSASVLRADPKSVTMLATEASSTIAQMPRIRHG